MLCVALIGGLIAFRASVHLGGGAYFPISSYDAWVMCSGVIGAPSGMLLARRHFGHRGRHGALRAVFGATLATLFAAIICGSLALPLYGTMFGPFTMIIVLAGAPLLGLVWLFGLVYIHFAATHLRTERDSIFSPQPSDVLLPK
ncbi:MAG: hypothetical protein JKX69_07250 [Rhodobacteraceae bacterium]|nr:hypothetical protein [Paracoccaceae bacterium]